MKLSMPQGIYGVCQRYPADILLLVAAQFSFWRPHTDTIVVNGDKSEKRGHDIARHRITKAIHALGQEKPYSNRVDEKNDCDSKDARSNFLLPSYLFRLNTINGMSAVIIQSKTPPNVRDRVISDRLSQHDQCTYSAIESTKTQRYD